MNRIRTVANVLGIAGAISIASLLASWVAIGFLLDGNAKLTVVFAVVAFLLDALDGFVARRLGTASAFGRTLDSMVDAINYSVLSALVASQILLPGPLGLIVGFVILAGGIIRLVLFTVDGYETEGDRLYYTGIVTPHLSLAVALLYFVSRFVELSAWITAPILLALALGQLSTVRTRKTGVLVFWIPVSTIIAVGALVWL
ncbi:MAG: hypothetical protein RLZZ319_294 [Actinomycetota bacterium]